MSSQWNRKMSMQSNTSLGKHASSEKYEDRDQPCKSVIFDGMIKPSSKKPPKEKKIKTQSESSVSGSRN